MEKQTAALVAPRTGVVAPDASERTPVSPKAKPKAKGLGRPKTPSKSSAVVQVVPSHGHGLLNVGNPGNVGNVRATGRPRDEVRRAATEALRKGPGVLERIMDGETIVTLTEKCPKCGHEPPSTFAVPVMVKPGEMVRAVEALDKLAGDQVTLAFSNEKAQAFFALQDRKGRERFGGTEWDALTADVAAALKLGAVT